MPTAVLVGRIAFRDSKVQLDPPLAAPASSPQVNLPVEALYKTVSDSAPVQPVDRPSWKKPLETWRREVEAAVRTARYVVVASEVVANRVNRRSKVEEALALTPPVMVKRFCMVSKERTVVVAAFWI